MTWILSEPLRGVYISAETDGLHILSKEVDITSPDIDFPTTLTSLGKRLPALIPQLLDPAPVFLPNIITGADPTTVQFPKCNID